MRKRQYEHQIIHLDEDILVVNKPAHISVIPDRMADNLCLKEILEREHGKLWVVHRLDRDTTGVLLFARNKEAHRTLSIAFQERKVDKIYQAIVYGKPYEDEGIIEMGLTDQPDRKGRYHTSEKGKIAITKYKILEELSHNYTLILLELITGRSHQIRVHCEYMGFPLAADPIYGHEPAFYLSSIKRRFNIGKFDEEYPLMDRNSLHARKISFEHPTSSEKVEFRAEHFKDFKAVLNQLNKW